MQIHISKKGYKVINIKHLRLNSNSSDLQKQAFERLVLLYGAELDVHQNRNTPKEILSMYAVFPLRLISRRFLKMHITLHPDIYAVKHKICCFIN